MQGTTSVYSKKVEFLWQHVLKVLDLVSSQKALQEANESSDKPKRVRKGQHDFNDFTFVSADMSKNINLKNDFGEKVVGNQDRTFNEKTCRDRKAALNFITVTPRQLIEKEGREVRNVRVNVYDKRFKDLLGHKEDFRINAQFTLATGMVGEDLNTECDLLNESVSLCDEEDTFLETSMLQPIHQAANQPELETVNCDDPGGVDDHDPGGVDDDVPPEDQGNSNSPSQNPMASTSLDAVPDRFDALLNSEEVSKDVTEQTPIQILPPSRPIHTDFPLSDDDDGAPFHGFTDAEQLRKSKRTRRNKFQETLNELKAPLVGPWEPVKPSDAIVPPKPSRKGKTCKAPSKTVLGKSRKRKNQEASSIPSTTEVNSSEPIEQYLVHDMVTQKYSSFGKLHGIGNELEALAEVEDKQREKVREEDGLSQNQQDKEEDKVPLQHSKYIVDPLG